MIPIIPDNRAAQNEAFARVLKSILIVKIARWTTAKELINKFRAIIRV